MIELINACKYYVGDSYETKALDKVSLRVEDGDFIAIQGKSGSGKSTLLNLIGCMDDLTDGRLIIDETETGELSKLALDKLRREKVSFVFQSYELMSNYTIYENIELPLNVQKIKKRKRNPALLKL